MSYVPGLDHDVFICFAEEDDQPLDSKNLGWVSTFSDHLEKVLGQHGCINASIHTRSPGNLSDTQKLEEIRRSASLVIILSEAYVASNWLFRNRQAFRDVVQSKGDCVFPVWMLDIDWKSNPEGKPDEISRLTGYPFYDPKEKAPRTWGRPMLDTDKKPYYDNLGYLANDLSNKLKQLRKNQQPEAAKDVRGLESGSLPSSTGPGETVYVAESIPELTGERDSVICHLEQAGFTVVPKLSLSENPAEYAQEVEKSLVNCRTFVQLLGATDIRGISATQYQVALRRVEAGLKIFQWRNHGLELGKVADPLQRELLMAETVRAESLMAFRQAITAYASNPLPKRSEEGLPVIIIDVPNRNELKEVLGLVQKLENASWSIHDKGTVSTLKKLLQHADGAVVFWGEGESDLAMERFLYCRTRWIYLKRNRNQLAIYDGPPSDKPPFKGANYPVIVGRHGLDLAKVEEYMSRVRQNVR